MPAYLAFPWLYRLVTKGAEEGSDRRLEIDAALGLGDAQATLNRRQIDRLKAAGIEIG